MNLPAQNVGGFDRPVIAQRHDDSQDVAQGARGSGEPRNELGCLKIEHDEIRLRSHLEPPDAILEPQAARGAERCKIERPQRRKILALVYISVLIVFLNDASADLAKTMAALDRRLSLAQAWLGLGG